MSEETQHTRSNIERLLAEMKIIDVWEANFLEQMESIAVLRRCFPIVAIDTEFSGFLRSTPRDAAEEHRYRDLKYNVDNLRMIQLGITLLDVAGNPRMAWQINFSDFDPDVDPYSPASMNLLKDSGIDVQRNRREGISSVRCAALLWEKLFSHHGGAFVTFHGLYDVGYLIKMLSGGRPLPETPREFITMASGIFNGKLYDIKYMARFCPGLHGGEVGLMKLANMLNVKADGVAHQAGFDCLVIGLSFREMNKRWAVMGDRDSMILYGLESVCHESKRASSSSSPLRRCSWTLPPGRFMIPPPMTRPPLAFPSPCFVGGHGPVPLLPPATTCVRWFQPVPLQWSFPGPCVVVLQSSF
ncbi:putative CCR4-associated factor 1 homolog 11 [Curcuma longa]|uniref:putative CCR4-associated factor 1 homolog 11 n=1 Tax=Curcuma longa TaxID=136217 RepID=UPI003D9FAE9C